MRRAAVVVPVVTAAEPYLLLVRRAAHLRRNPGQIAFPGGMVEEGETFEAAALREAEEEIGIARERFTIIDRLDEIGTLSSIVAITPFVATLEPPVVPAIDETEIAAVFEVPVSAVVAEGAVAPTGEIHPHNGLPMWAFNYEGIHVWGATARILRSFAQRYAVWSFGRSA